MTLAVFHPWVFLPGHSRDARQEGVDGHAEEILLHVAIHSLEPVDDDL
jgi:hypothetical protein